MQWKNLIWLVLVPVIGCDAGELAMQGEPVAASSEQTGLDIMERIAGIGKVNPSKYGIRNGCILTSRIRSIRFKDDQIAIVDVGRKKQVIIKLRAECGGIKSEGFIYKSRDGKLCQRFGTFEVIGRSMPCVVDSIEPYVNIEATSKIKKLKFANE